LCKGLNIEFFNLCDWCLAVVDFTSLVNVIVPLVAGVLLGFAFRNRKRVDLGKVVFGAIVVLIFSMGFGIGANGELLAAMPRVGFSATVIVWLVLFFSVVFVLIARRIVRMK